jgi:V/A-type H+-transporting ATPase subunit A
LGKKIGDQMKVVGEEDLSLDDYIHYQKSEFFDAAILQQNSFDEVDAGPGIKRTSESLKLSVRIINHNFSFNDKETARRVITKITSLFRDLNLTNENNLEFEKNYNNIINLLKN